MTTPLQQASPAYAASLRRWRELDSKIEECSAAEIREWWAIGEQLELVELEYDTRQAARREEGFSDLVDDYEFAILEAGNLGGTEL